MKRTFLIVALVIGLALGLCVAVGVAWYFLWQHDVGTASVQTTSGTEPNAEAGNAGGTTGNKNARATKFAELDLDQDGRLSLSEFSGTRRPAEAAKWFERRDVNKDGFISREEFLPFSAGPKTP